MVLAPELMADVRMARHRLAVTRIVAILTDAFLKGETRTDHVVRTVRHDLAEIRIVVEARKVADQMDHRSEVMQIVARLVTGAPVVIADLADLRTWDAETDLQKVIPQKVARDLGAVKVLRHAAAKAAGALALQCEAVDRRSLVVDRGRADHRGLSVVTHRAADLRSVVADRDDLQWDHRGSEAEVRKVADRRLVAADRDVHRWDHRG